MLAAPIILRARKSVQNRERDPLREVAKEQDGLVDVVLVIVERKEGVCERFQSNFLILVLSRRGERRPSSCALILKPRHGIQRI